MSTTATPTDGTQFQPDPYDDDWDEEPITPRATLRKATKALLIAAMIALAFAAGIYAHREWGASTQSTAQGGFPQFGGGRGQAGGFPGGGLGGTGAGTNANLVTGQVAYRKGRTLYITDTSGNITKVTVPAGLEVSTTATTTVKSIRPGDTVTVRGTDAGAGTLTATSVSIGGSPGAFGAAPQASGSTNNGG